MGLINVNVQGSFRNGGSQSFSAMSNGHAHAVTEAIAFLVNEVLPEAINQDHELHDDGAKPSRGFTKKEKVA
jgi:hypothetical protein